MFYTLLVQGNRALDDVLGKISPPAYIKSGIDASGNFTGITEFMNNLLKLVFVIAGIWAFVNLIIAGFGFMTAGGDSKAITKAWDRIWQSFLGLLIIVLSFLIAAIMGILLFKDPTAILNPKI